MTLSSKLFWTFFLLVQGVFLICFSHIYRIRSATEYYSPISHGQHSSSGTGTHHGNLRHISSSFIPRPNGSSLWRRGRLLRNKKKPGEEDHHEEAHGGNKDHACDPEKDCPVCKECPACSSEHKNGEEKHHGEQNTGSESHAVNIVGKCASADDPQCAFVARWFNISSSLLHEDTELWNAATYLEKEPSWQSPKPFPGGKIAEVAVRMLRLLYVAKHWPLDVGKSSGFHTGSQYGGRRGGSLNR